MSECAPVQTEPPVVVRYDAPERGGGVDECFVWDAATVHLERMAPDGWSLVVTRAGGERFVVSIHAPGETRADFLGDVVPRVNAIVTEGGE